MTTTTDTAELGYSTRPANTLGRALAAFGITLVAGVLFVLAFLLAYPRLHDGRVMSGVSVSGVSIAGLDRDQAQARLREQLPSLASGALTVRLGETTETIPFADFGRDYDYGPILDTAFAVGREGSFLDQSAEQLRALARGAEIQPAMTLDRASLDARIQAMAAAAGRTATDASVSFDGTTFVAAPGVDGMEYDVAGLQSTAAAAVDSLQAESASVEATAHSSEPTITTAEAEAAAQAANAMAAQALVLVAGSETVTIPATTVRSWLRVEPTEDGSLAPVLDRTGIGPSLADYASSVVSPAKDASFAFADGNRVEAVPAQSGQELDVDESVNRIAQAIESQASGATAPQVELAVRPTEPSFTTAEAEAAAPKVRRISAWNTRYTVGESNFFGKNIQIPTKKLNGVVLAPGQKFDFWKYVGDVSRRAGYGSGGAIINGRTQLTGALAGGICSCSTTIFNAALRAGLEMGKRDNHYYYITRYPVGLDATVSKSGKRVVQNMTFRNDTEYPVLIRGINSYGKVRFELHSVPTGRTVEFSRPVIVGRQAARDTIEYTDTLAPGSTKRVEYPADGFRATVVRIVRDADGNVIHRDRYVSNYSRVDGVTLVGRRPGDPPAGTVRFT